MTRVLPAVLIPAAVCAAALVAAPVQAMSLRDVAKAALAHDPRFAASTAGIEAARYGVQAADASDAFTLGLGADVGRSELRTAAFFPQSGLRTPNTLALTGSQPLYNGGLTAALDAAAKSEVEAALESRRDVGGQLILAALTAVLDVKRDRETLKLSQVTARTLGSARQDVGKRFEAGEATRTDQSQADARLAEAEAQVRRAQAQLRTSEIALTRLIGPEAGVPEASWPQLLPVAPTLGLAVEQSRTAPAVVAARHEAEAAQARIAAAIAEYRPHLSLDGHAVTQDDSDFGYDRINTWAVQLKLSVPIFTGGLAQARAAEARAKATQAGFMARDEEARFAETAAKEWELLQATDDVIAAVRAQAEASELALDGVRKELKAGSRTTLDLLDAERERLAADVNLVAALRDRAVTAFRLLAACGKLELEAVPE
jgi:outer membrane protein